MNTQPPGPVQGVYGRAHVPLITAAAALAADRAAREQYGIAEGVLMESAGRAAALVLHRLHPRGRVVGIAGGGNNGGDAIVMLRVLRAWGREVVAIAAGSAPPPAHLLHGSDLVMRGADTDVERALASAAVIVDGMLGTGARDAPRGAVAEWIQRVNDAARPVLALDIPSGIDASTGAVHQPCVRADTTVTFGWPKLGMLLHPARAQCGRIVAVEIGFPDATAAATTLALTPQYARARLRARPPNAHKGSVGRLLVVAGQEGMAGAAAIAVEAAVRAGAGLVRIASTAGNRVVLQSLVPEATFLDRDALQPTDTEQMHALVAGPGLGTDTAAQRALQHACDLTAGKPTLLDADALNILAGSDALAQLAAARPLVITPHAGELSRLTGRSIADIIADAPAAARAAAAAFGCVVLLKGMPSLIASPDGQLLVNTLGSSDLASAGMGDQLAGTIGALLAGGAEPMDAAAAGLFLSGRAAELAGRGTALTPRDVSMRLARAAAEPGPPMSALDLPFITLDQPARW